MERPDLSFISLIKKKKQMMMCGKLINFFEHLEKAIDLFTFFINSPKQAYAALICCIT